MSRIKDLATKQFTIFHFKTRNNMIRWGLITCKRGRDVYYALNAGPGFNLDRARAIVSTGWMDRNATILSNTFTFSKANQFVRSFDCTKTNIVTLGQMPTNTQFQVTGRFA